MADTSRREIPFCVPPLGVEPLRLSVWFAEPGESVYEGDRIVEIQAGAATFDVSAPATGRAPCPHDGFRRTRSSTERSASACASGRTPGRATSDTSLGKAPTSGSSASSRPISTRPWISCPSGCSSTWTSASSSRVRISPNCCAKILHHGYRAHIACGRLWTCARGPAASRSCLRTVFHKPVSLQRMSRLQRCKSHGATSPTTGCVRASDWYGPTFTRRSPGGAMISSSRIRPTYGPRPCGGVC